MFLHILYKYNPVMVPTQDTQSLWQDTLSTLNSLGEFMIHTVKILSVLSVLALILMAPNLNVYGVLCGCLIHPMLFIIFGTYIQASKQVLQ